MTQSRHAHGHDRGHVRGHVSVTLCVSATRCECGRALSDCWSFHCRCHDGCALHVCACGGCEQEVVVLAYLPAVIMQH